jgi:hypothetical protein
MPFRGEQKMAENIDYEALYEEAQDIAAWESGFRELQKHQQETRIEQIMTDLLEEIKCKIQQCQH